MTTGPEPRRLRARNFGRRAEWLASLWLGCKGYRILARNYAVRGGEVDLIVRRGDTIAFVEVKARPSLEAALVAITPTKRVRIERAARAWLARHPEAARGTLRGDGLFIVPGRWPRHIADAFELRLI